MGGEGRGTTGRTQGEPGPGRGRRSGQPPRAPLAHLEVLLQLDLMLPCQVVMLFLELGEQELLLQLLLLLERQKLLLQLLLPQCGVNRACQSPPQLRGAGAASPTPHGAGHGSWQHRLHLHCGDKRWASGSPMATP